MKRRDFVTSSALGAVALGAGHLLLEACGIETALPNGQPDPGLLVGSGTAALTDAFVAAIAKHRHFDRESNPPRV